MKLSAFLHMYRLGSAKLFYSKFMHQDVKSKVYLCCDGTYVGASPSLNNLNCSAVLHCEIQQRKDISWQLFAM